MGVAGTEQRHKWGLRILCGKRWLMVKDARRMGVQEDDVEIGVLRWWTGLEGRRLGGGSLVLRLGGSGLCSKIVFCLTLLWRFPGASLWFV